MPEDAQAAVSRIIHRDDLLALAADADQAIDIVRQREDIARRGSSGQTLFELALDRQLKLGTDHTGWSTRAQAWNYAGVLLTFCSLVGTELRCRYTAEELHLRALRELEDHESETKLDRDLTIGVIVRHNAARYFRLAGRHHQALSLAKRPKEALFGTGAEPYMGHYLYEVGATLIALKSAREVIHGFSEWERYWAHNERAQGFFSRHRYDLIRALALWHDGGASGQVHGLLTAASEHLEATPPIETARGRQARQLSLSLAFADFLAAQADEGPLTQAIKLGEQALELVNQIRARWSVVARSRAPLALVAQRIYGDLALLAERLPGQRGARLGLQSALSAKQTGFAARIRDGLAFDDNPIIRDIVDEIVRVEASSNERLTDNSRSRDEQLTRLRSDLADAVSPMLADTIFPTSIDVAALIAAIGPRYALDYVELRDTLQNEPHLFRTFIRPGGSMRFERCEAVESLRRAFDRPRQGAAVDRPVDRSVDRSVDREVEGERSPEQSAVDWRGLAEALLPADLTSDVLIDADLPVRLLISGHSWLSWVPWAGLMIDAAGTRLVERAVVTQTPILTCLSGELSPRVGGWALIRLVGRNENGVNVRLERTAWGLDASTDGLPTHECDLDSGKPPRPREGRFDTALAEGGWQFVHVAAHGTGAGLDQVLAIPQERMSAARALGLRWPASVLIASCHVGLLLNENEAEPLSLVMSLLTGGAACVVAGIARVDDSGTGETAGVVVREIRSGPVGLDIALWRAQLSAVRRGMAEEGWALLAAYVR